jgi:predicted phosphodiesterase
MTAKERQRLQRLEIENRELRAALEHHQDVNRKMIYEIVEMRAKLELVDLALHGGTD